MQSRRSSNLAMLGLENWAVTLFYLFLVTDIGFIILHLIYSYTALIPGETIPSKLFSLETDRGYSELLQYVKEFWIALLLGVLALRKRSRLFLSWSLLFFYFLIDDATGFRERLAVVISRKLAFVGLFNLRPIDFGELTISAGFGLFFLAAIATTYRFSDRCAREISKKLTLLLLALVFFGVAIDILHIAIKIPAIEPILIAVEEGGEMIVMSLITCFVFSQSLQQKAAHSVEQQDLVRLS